MFTISVHGKIYSLAVSPDGKWIVGGGSKGQSRNSGPGIIFLWSLDKGREIFTRTEVLGKITRVAFAQDGGHVVSKSADGTINMWDLTGGVEDSHFKLAGVKDLGYQNVHLAEPSAFSFDGKRVVAPTPQSDGVKIKVWETLSGKEVLNLNGHLGTVYSTAFSCDGSRIATGSSVGKDTNGTVQGEVKVWDARSGRELWSGTGHKAPIVLLAFSPDGRWLISGTRGGSDIGGVGTIKIWDASSGQSIPEYVSHSWVDGLLVDPDSKRILTCGGTASEASGRPGSWAIWWNDRRNLVDRGGFTQTIKMWDIATGMEIPFLLHAPVHETCLVSSPDGKRLLCRDWREKTLKVCQLSAGQESRTFSNHRGAVEQVAISPDGKRIFSCSHTARYAVGREEAHVWNTLTGRVLFSLPAEAVSVGKGTFSPNGQLVATWSYPKGGLVKGTFSPEGELLGTESSSMTNSKKPVAIWVANKAGGGFRSS